MKNKDDNARKRKNHQPIVISPSDSKSSDRAKSVLRDVTNLNQTLPSSGSTHNFTNPSTAFSLENQYYGTFSLHVLTVIYYTVFYD